MQKQISIFLSMFWLMLVVANAQIPTKRELQLMQRIAATDFMLQFDSLANYIESAAARTKARTANYNSEKVKKLKEAYNSSIINFNNILLQIQADFLDKKKVREMKNNPYAYAELYRNKLNAAQKQYQDNFLRTQSEIEEVETANNFSFLQNIKTMMEEIYELCNTLKSLRYETHLVNEEYFQRYFYAPHQIKMWEQLSVN